MMPSEMKNFIWWANVQKSNIKNSDVTLMSVSPAHGRWRLNIAVDSAGHTVKSGLPEVKTHTLFKQQ